VARHTFRKIYSYNAHLAAADYFLDAAGGEDNQSEKINSMGTLVFSAFALEAFLNHVGPQLLEVWDNEHLKKHLSPGAKLGVIAKCIGLEIDFESRPFQTFRTLFRFRNVMAHSATEKLSEENAKHFLQIGVGYWPAAEWEKLCSAEVAKNALKDVERIIDLIEDKSGIEQIPRFLLSEFMQI